jgi:hypothetical protein
MHQPALVKHNYIVHGAYTSKDTRGQQATQCSRRITSKHKILPFLDTTNQSRSKGSICYAVILTISSALKCYHPQHMRTTKAAAAAATAAACEAHLETCEHSH